MKILVASEGRDVVWGRRRGKMWDGGVEEIELWYDGVA